MLRRGDILSGSTNVAGVRIKGRYREESNLLLILDIQKSVGMGVGSAREGFTANRY